MKIRYDSLWLAPGGFEDTTSGLSINGLQINDEFRLCGAAAVALQPRGNRSTTISFSVARIFDTLRAAERFYHSQFSDVAQQGSLYFQAGIDADSEWIRYDGAVLDTILPRQSGRSVIVQYSFRAGIPVFDSAPPSVTEPTSDMIRRSTTAIALGASSVTVTFSTPFSSLPVVLANVQSPNGADYITCVIRDSSVTVSGFTADLSAPTPTANYKLSWIASA